MNILVCCKQVPASKTTAEPHTHALVRDHIRQMMNPADQNALEAALSLKEAAGGTVTVMTMGKPAAVDILLQAASLGADRLYLLTDPRFSGSDTYATAVVLSRAVSLTGPYSLILCGNRTTDGGTGQVGPELAALLGLEAVTQCSSVRREGADLVCTRRLEQEEQLLRSSLPVVADLLCGSNTPRLPSISSLRRARAFKIYTLDAESLSLSGCDCGFAGSPTKVVSVRPYNDQKRRDKQIQKGTGKAAQAAAIIYQCSQPDREAGNYDKGIMDLL